MLKEEHELVVFNYSSYYEAISESKGFYAVSKCLIFLTIFFHSGDLFTAWNLFLFLNTLD